MVERFEKMIEVMRYHKSDHNFPFVTFDKFAGFMDNRWRTLCFTQGDAIMDVVGMGHGFVHRR